jgi:hypothetical protein
MVPTGVIIVENTFYTRNRSVVGEMADVSTVITFERPVSELLTIGELLHGIPSRGAIPAQLVK